ncbi:MAG TPA: CxxxxCH/CxxCH domain-containing protein [Malonomonas sp.]
MGNLLTIRQKTFLKSVAVGAILLLCSISSVEAATSSPLVHNSDTTSSTKWGGNWGKAGGQYGAFDCVTCHINETNNIKRVKTSISAPDSSNWNSSGTASVAVIFQSALDGAADFGDDSGGHATSNKICEVCHSQTKYHRYNTSAQTGGLNHYNQKDCIVCHQHSQGFSASCDACHGNPPITNDNNGSTQTGLVHTPGTTGSALSGAHAGHVTELTGPLYSCDVCHGTTFGTGTNHTGDGSGKVTIDFNAFGTTGNSVAGTYNGQAAVVAGAGYDGDNAGTAGALTCSNTYCHALGAGGTVPAWNGAVVCGNCHADDSANPISNLPSGDSHNTHVNSGGTGIYQGGAIQLSCNKCHGTNFSDSTHVNGEVKWDVGSLTSSYLDPRAAGVTYSGLATSSTGALAPSSAYATCNNVSCHWNNHQKDALSTPATPVWNSGAATCTTCHNNGTNDGSVANAAPASGSHAVHVGAADAYVTCDSCHGSGATTGTHTGHINNVTNYAGDLIPATNFTDVGGRSNVADTCAIICHKDGTWGGAINWTDGVTDSCTDCHSNAYSGKAGPSVVTNPFAAPTGSHLKETTAQSLPTTAATWKTRCLGCHTKHYDASAIKIDLPASSWDNPGTAATETTNMRTQLGINYIGADHNGIYLKGSLGADEADACWSCHGTDETINEWGFNADTNGSFPNNGWSGVSHNFGTPYTTSGHTTATSAWATATGDGYWRKDYYSTSTVLSRRITSMHTANVNAAGISSVATSIDANGNVVATTQENRNQIRCSYCHDLHSLNLAVGDSSSGRPYLRGSWMGNPYGPDAPPLSTYNYATTGGPGGVGNRFYASGGGVQQVAVPRLFTTTTQEKGGYFIDQNSGWPTRVGNTPGGADKTLAETAGICTLCHGSDIDGMDFYTSNSMWRDGMVNGHSNAALGGTGANRRNIFDGFRGGTSSGMHMALQGTLNYSGDFGIAVFDGYTIKNGPFFDAYDGAGRTNANHPPKNLGFYGGTVGSYTQGANGQFTAWFNGSTTANNMAAIGTDGSKASGLNARAHSFTCSKCHSPHASGLPALLITNCLDTSAATWSKSYNGLNIGAQSTSTWGKIAANNCHRKETWGTAAQNRDTGWHKLAPGQ